MSSEREIKSLNYLLSYSATWFICMVDCLVEQSAPLVNWHFP
jgi:hypothetical protein